MHLHVHPFANACSPLLSLLSSQAHTMDRMKLLERERGTKARGLEVVFFWEKCTRFAKVQYPTIRRLIGVRVSV
jgi:hypothetical protein